MANNIVRLYHHSLPTFNTLSHLSYAFALFRSSDILNMMERMGLFTWSKYNWRYLHISDAANLKKSLMITADDIWQESPQSTGWCLLLGQPEGVYKDGKSLLVLCWVLNHQIPNSRNALSHFLTSKTYSTAWSWLKLSLFSSYHWLASPTPSVTQRPLLSTNLTLGFAAPSVKKVANIRSVRGPTAKHSATTRKKHMWNSPALLTEMNIKVTSV